ncbi:TetR/AcrR family transcriptional regulator [Clostridium sporogenes]|uniref:TetR/AcrR family transcriptional regulator n=1 Tax=Clostridium sporogenes TaxID=1509 RepID=UPI000E12EA13|nr:TetR/AcrR family transcriptional regulator [Clostridium sporogenes]NFT02881.1 TetR/AcrR family transcriptional regulator [Clostridium sporogenes]NFT30315.1 TetR/AcrR family transcriptional regulator [Clostridium sporogenes]NFT38658.1 TetR/AcrR family transcriptional regulator [Clostridium sporogenes]NFT52491.1 TetR/AcrR family transcriptional regulator [Clostridium sporogenes]NFT73652.1 TetR/AcrR family transcriptional regulator [Clostridium sporogenes]
MPKGIMLTPEQQAERREEIIGVALRLIEKNGFQKTSMREIAVLANMGKSSLYDFFKTKDEIVVYAVEKKIEETIQKVHRIIVDESSPEQCLRKIMLNHLGVPKQYRTVLMWLNTESDYLEEEYRKRLKAARYAYQDIIKSVIENGVTAGIFRKTNADLMARLLINSVIAIIYTSRPSASPEKMLDETMNIFLHGIMNNGGELL